MEDKDKQEGENFHLSPSMVDANIQGDPEEQKKDAGHNGNGVDPYASSDDEK